MKMNRTSGFFWCVVVLFLIGMPAASFSKTVLDGQDVYEIIVQRIADTEWSSVSEVNVLADDVELMLETLTANGSWPDINYSSTAQTNWEPIAHLNRVRLMALAYTHEASPLKGDAVLYARISKALEFWQNADPRSTNWYNQQIGSPQRVGVILILMRLGEQLLSSSLETAMLNRMAAIGGRPDQSGSQGTGANKVDIATHWVYRGCLTRDDAVLSFGVQQVYYPVFKTMGEGIQHDFSYFQHGQQFFTGGYGYAYISGIARVANFTRATVYAMPDEKLQLLVDFTRDAYLRLMRGGTFLYNVIGRGLSRPGALNASSAIRVAQLVRNLDPDNSDVYDAAIQRLNKAMPASYEMSTLHTHYWRGDYSLYYSPDYSFDVRMASNRTYRNENGNGENLKGYFLSEGAYNITVDGNEYYNIFPVWDWAKIPGITAPHKQTIPLPAQWGTFGTSAFAGGVSNGLQGITVFQLNNNEYSINTRAKKSWFVFGDEVVCLGAAIHSTAAEVVLTTLNQCLLRGDVVVRSGSDEQILTKDEHLLSDNIDWVYHDKVGYFPAMGGALHISNRSQSGNWNSINSAQSTATVSHEVFAMWLNHGMQPDNADYAYVLVPGKSIEDIRAFDVENIEILINSDSLQVVRHARLNLWSFVFYKAGSFDHPLFSLKVDNACALMLQDPDTELVSGWISDPSQLKKELRLRFDSEVLGSEKELRLQLPELPYAGSTVDFSIDQSADDYVYVPVEEVNLYPVDDSYVVNGTSASTVFGVGATSDRLIIKKDNPGYNREVFFKFNLEGLNVDSIETAVLQIYVRSANVSVSATNWQLFYVENDNWSETTLNWNNKPSYSTLLGTHPGSPAGSVVTFDIKQAIVDELSKGDYILSLQMIATERGADAKTDANFYSKDTPDLDKHPRILVRKKTATIADEPFVEGRNRFELSDDWRFQKTTLGTPAQPSFNDNGWQVVTIPHTWNAFDAQDGGGNYDRTVGWYRKRLEWDERFDGKRVYVEVLAASLQSECYVNGSLVGAHKGGYNASRYDITEYLRTDTVNLIAFKVDNRHSSEIIPLSGDFSVFGGIYRKVYLVVAEPVHVDLDDCASNGLYLTTTEVSAASARLEIRARVVNKSTVDKVVDLKAILKNPDSFDEISLIPNPLFDISTIAPGGVIETIVETQVLIPAGGSYEFKRSITVQNPRLWDGLTDPFRYQVDFAVTANDKLIDQVSDYVGFRFFHADNTGFYLNGRLYPLRGVNRHQDWKDLGYAVSEREHDIDFAMMYEIGANAVRLAHYPQDPYFHELFDKYGVVVWVEIPFVDRFASDTTLFMQTTRLQLREMIRQRYNRPSILMWGLQNEVSTGSYDAMMSVIMPQLHYFTKQEDPTGRLTVQAQAGADRSNWTTDLFGKNQYPGWYQSGTFGAYMDSYRNRHFVNGKYHPVGMSEYGAGGSVNQHEMITLSGTTVPGSPYGHQNPWHPEEYQSLIHELAIKDIMARPWIWGTFVWAMFDFASDSRREGDQPGINDKGIVTHDRSIKKDAFYVYKVNWNDEPEVHIASRRFTQRESERTPVKVYTNRASVGLFVNGVSQGVLQRTDANCGILEWKDVQLPNKGPGDAGKNVVVALSSDNVADTVIWYRHLSSSTLLFSESLVIDNVQRVISLTVPLSVDNLSQLIRSQHNATLVLLAVDGLSTVTEGDVQVGMKLKVTAEDGETTVIYEFIMQHIALKKKVTSSADENVANKASNAVDGDVSTRWAAPNNATAAAPHWLEIDLGKNFVLNNIGIHWFNSEGNPRAYRYTVMVKKEGETAYSTAIDRSSNTEGGFVSDAIGSVTGRYVRIRVTGSTSSSAYSYPSIYEVQVNGWMISSSVYTIDWAAKTIAIPYSAENLDQEAFISKLEMDGNLTYRIESAAYYIVDGAQLIIIDSGGNETVFTLNVDASMKVDRVDDSNNWIRLSNVGEELKVALLMPGRALLRIMNLQGKLLVSREIVQQDVLKLTRGLYLIHVDIAGVQSMAIKYLMN